MANPLYFAWSDSSRPWLQSFLAIRTDCVQDAIRFWDFTTNTDSGYHGQAYWDSKNGKLMRVALYQFSWDGARGGKGGYLHDGLWLNLDERMRFGGAQLATHAHASGTM